jgi:hypothetical protein
MRKLIHDFFNYLRNPINIPSKRPLIKYLLFWFVIALISAFFFGSVSSLIRTHFHLQNLVLVSLRGNIFLNVILIAPICEEILIRSLLKFKKINLILFVCSLIAYGILAALHSKPVNLTIVLFLLISFIILVTTIPRSKIEEYIDSKFKYFFYASCITFGLLHITNFSGNIYILAAYSILLTGPQIVLGFILGYIRMNYGLIHSILLHMSINAFSLFLVLKHI